MNEFTSKYSGKCKICKTTWEVDDKIYVEKGIDRWCASKACAVGDATGTPEPIQPKAIPASAQPQAVAAPAHGDSDSFARTSATHDRLWEMAGRKIEPVDFSTFVDDRERNKSRHILRQTFYYGLISIHTGNPPKR